LLDIPLATKECPLYQTLDDLDWNSRLGISQARADEVGRSFRAMVFY